MKKRENDAKSLNIGGGSPPRKEIKAFIRSPKVCQAVGDREISGLASGWSVTAMALPIAGCQC